MTTPTISIETLQRVAGYVPARKAEFQAQVIAAIHPHLDVVFSRFKINTPLRQAHFLAQVCHESDGLSAMEEYASGAAYEGRKDLGNIYPGDGIKHKGRGPFMLTGRYNYAEYGEIIGVDLTDDPNISGDEDDPQRAADPVVGLQIAAAYWDKHGLNVLADRNDLRGITRRINGGYNGLADRRERFDRIAPVLGIASEEVRPTLLQLGVSSPDVVILQKRLNQLNYFVGAEDGKFGGKTDDGVRGFQRDFGLTIDGKVRIGGETWSEISKALEVGDSRDVFASRSQATVASLAQNGSRIAGASQKGLAAVVTSVAGSFGLLLTESASLFKEYRQPLEEFMQPFGGATSLTLGVLALACVYSGWQHIKAGEARTDDHRSGKTS